MMPNKINFVQSTESLKSKDYPDGFKYSLIAINPDSEIKVLIDSHNPKGHHYHINDDELPYLYPGPDRLIEGSKDL